MKIKPLIMTLMVAFLSGMMVTSCSSNADQANSEEVSAEEEAAEPVTANAEFTMGIDGMMCSKSCVSYIKKNLGKADGVASVNVDYDNKQCTVKYDNTITTGDDLINTVNGMADGRYKASKLDEANDESAEEEVTEEVSEETAS